MKDRKLTLMGKSQQKLYFIVVKCLLFLKLAFCMPQTSPRWFGLNEVFLPEEIQFVCSKKNQERIQFNETAQLAK